MDGLNPISDDVEFAAFIFDAYGTDGVISVYIDHVGVGVDGWFDDDHESSIDGENEDNIDEHRNGNVEFNEDAFIMNRTSNDPFLSKLCVDEGEDNNIVDDDEPPMHAIFNELASTSEPQQHDEVELTLIHVDTTQNDFHATHNDSESSSAGGCGQYMQVTPPRSYEAGDFVGEDVEVENIEGGQGEANGVVEDDGQGIVNVVVEEAVEIPNVQVQQVRPISDILKRIRRRKSERILKIKLRKTVGGVDDPGNSKGKALIID
ncbi:unnamed protein product [Lactuca virosa]|uniref:Uncharacterized protein n=1 Tax=Lactuca virosa TaxID=75947 RepID=A0AAU9MVR6_9ASTR|nr:unnamed protein product [Lactuca virosa]